MRPRRKGQSGTVLPKTTQTGIGGGVPTVLLGGVSLPTLGSVESWPAEDPGPGWDVIIAAAVEVIGGGGTVTAFVLEVQHSVGGVPGVRTIATGADTAVVAVLPLGPPGSLRLTVTLSAPGAVAYSAGAVLTGPAVYEEVAAWQR